MKLETQHEHIELPNVLREKLQAFRHRVRIVKLLEGIFAAIFGLAISFCLLFILDRFWDTPHLVRWAMLIAGALGVWLFLPVQVYRWFWRHRRLEQVARLLRKSFPRIGDQLLGIIELANNDEEQGRSATLVRAAMGQVADATRNHDFATGVPNPRQGRWALAAIVFTVIATATIVLVPSAGWNALSRWAMPWRDIDRYTFVQLQDLPSRLVVPYAESFQVAASLRPESEWMPTSAAARYLDQVTIYSNRSGERFDFEIPPQRDPGELVIAVGDDQASIAVEPVPRPELTGIKATIDLPAYLKYTKPLVQQASSGQLSLLEGSRVQIEANASRELSQATLDGESVEVTGRSIKTSQLDAPDSRTLTFSWRDTYGLAAKEPLELELRAVSDDAPTIQCRNPKTEQVVLESEVIKFEITAADDFGVKSVGLEWEGMPNKQEDTELQAGEKIAAPGGPELRELNAIATFSAKAEGIRPQVLRVRGFVDDYLPGRQRVYSASYTLYVLNKEDHALWIAEQLDNWRRQTLEVYERELQLNDKNKELRALDPEQLDNPEVRRQIAQQASAERANGRQLQNLSNTGEQLIEQALRNPEFDAALLESWAETLQSLRDISENRMPSVADLLREASDAAARSPSSSSPAQPSESSATNSDSTGDSQGEEEKTTDSPEPSDSSESSPSSDNAATPPNAQNNQSQSNSKDSPSSSPPSQTPSISDVESSLAPPEEESSEESGGSPSSGGGRLTLPTTSVPGGSTSTDTPTGTNLNEAVEEQDTLLEEFAKVADELNEILQNLEGSTFVKRLKAASRYQMNIAGKLNREVLDSFGADVESVSQAVTEDASVIAELEYVQSETIYEIEEDLEAFAERMSDGRFQAVAEQMKVNEVVAEIRGIGEAVQDDNFSGTSIAVAEYWADTLDRWADELLDPEQPPGPPSGPSEGSNESLPPELVLEVMRILQEEIALRDSTRSVNQARPALDSEDYSEKAYPLSRNQDELANRTREVVRSIRELPEGSENFGQEMQLLNRVSSVMREAADILKQPETGPTAIAAETEVIELLLKAQRAAGGGGGGGGGGASGGAGGEGGGSGGNAPGGGGSGSTDKSALALIGLGLDGDAKVDQREVGQATGVTGASLPAEYRTGLDSYFNALENRSPE